MKKDLIKRIVEESGVGEDGLRVTLSRMKKRHDLKSIEQAACFYIKKNKLDINVSSVIDDVTRRAVESLLKPAKKEVVTLSTSSVKKAKPILVPKLKWMDKKYYSLADRLSDFYPYLFVFENALRIKIQYVMSSKDANWWESKVKKDLIDTYNYAAAEQAKQSKLKMIGQAKIMTPLDYLTVSHLEAIIVKYQGDFIPSMFPNLHFFTGHMVIVKRVRNAIAHMAPATTAKDIKNAKSEIDILLQHLSTL